MYLLIHFHDQVVRQLPVVWMALNSVPPQKPSKIPLNGVDDRSFLVVVLQPQKAHSRLFLLYN